jgi:hypothetical protein
MKEKSSYKSNEDTRIWCEYCRIFVYNNRINREKHDNSPQHKANFKKKIELLRKEEQVHSKQSLDKSVNLSAESFYSPAKEKSSNLSSNSNTLLNVKSASIKKPILGLSAIKAQISKKTVENNTDTVDSQYSMISSNCLNSNKTYDSQELKNKIFDDEKACMAIEISPKSSVMPNESDCNLESVDMSSLFKSKPRKR